LAGAGAVHGPFGNDEGGAWREFDSAILEIDQELTFNDVEKFIVVVVFVPVIFSLDDTETDDGLVHLTESLVIPFEGAGIGESFLVDYFERMVVKVQTSFIGEVTGVAHRDMVLSVGGEDYHTLLGADATRGIGEWGTRPLCRNQRLWD
jgi:hypothetical protein